MGAVDPQFANVNRAHSMQLQLDEEGRMAEIEGEWHRTGYHMCAIESSNQLNKQDVF